MKNGWPGVVGTSALDVYSGVLKVRFVLSASGVNRTPDLQVRSLTAVAAQPISHQATSERAPSRCGRTTNGLTGAGCGHGDRQRLERQLPASDGSCRGAREPVRLRPMPLIDMGFAVQPTRGMLGPKVGAEKTTR